LKKALITAIVYYAGKDQILQNRWLKFGKAENWLQMSNLKMIESDLNG